VKKVVSFALLFAVAAFLLDYGMNLLRTHWVGLAIGTLAVLGGVVWWRVRRFRDSNKY
jgi:hypothetical protein